MSSTTNKRARDEHDHSDGDNNNGDDEGLGLPRWCRRRVGSRSISIGSRSSSALITAGMNKISALPALARLSDGGGLWERPRVQWLHRHLFPRKVDALMHAQQPVRLGPSNDASAGQKFFSCTWINHDSVMIGAKTSQLYIYCPSKQKLELFLTVRRDRDIDRRNSSSSTTYSNVTNNNATVHDANVLIQPTTTIPISQPHHHPLLRQQGTRMLFLGHQATNPAQPTTAVTAVIRLRHMVRVSLMQQERMNGGGGVRCLSWSPSRRRLAAAGTPSSKDIAIFEPPMLFATHTISAHSDWVFGVDWMSEDRVLSCSRDHSVALWRVPDTERSRRCSTPSPSSSTTSASFLPAVADLPTNWSTNSSQNNDNNNDKNYGNDDNDVEGEDDDGEMHLELKQPEWQDTCTRRVRDCKAHPAIDGALTLSLGNVIQLWAATPAALVRTITHTLAPEHTDTVSLAVDREGGSIPFAAGHSNGVSFFDPRLRSTNQTFLLRTVPGLGVVRSLSFQSNGRFLTCGGGNGRVAFADTRMRAFIDLLPNETNTDDCSSNDVRNKCIRVSGAMLADDSFGNERPSAVYAHAWDPTETKLFVAGGPLYTGVVGSFATMLG